MAEFVVLIGDQLHKFSRYEDIPERFDNLIKFLPDISEGPHTEEEHAEIDDWNNKLKKLMERESAGRN